jgi:epoxyqueuosine reductase
MPPAPPGPAEATATLKAEALRLGFDLAGAAPAVAAPGIARLEKWLAGGLAGQMHYLADRLDAYRDPTRLLPGARSILVLGLNYRTVEPAAAGPGEGRVSRYAWGRDYHEVVRRRLRRLADFHRRLLPDARARGVVDTAPLMEREFGRLAGLGWFGKNTALVNERLGSWFFLAALLTTAELAYDKPSDGPGCGACRACLDACPNGALGEPYRVDARRCISYLTVELRGPVPVALRQSLGERVFGCDLCQEICPFNRQTPATSEPDFLPAAGANPLGLARLFSLDEAAFRRRFGQSPLWRARRAGLLRSAAVALGNRPDAAALPALLHGLDDADPVVRAACAWALGHYPQAEAGEALGRRLEAEMDPEVRAEIGAALETRRAGG